jgi:hypothetical protein
MSRRVAIHYRPIARARNNLIANHQHRANGNLTTLARRARLIHRGVHEPHIIVIHPSHRRAEYHGMSALRRIGPGNAVALIRCAMSLKFRVGQNSARRRIKIKAAKLLALF